MEIQFSKIFSQGLKKHRIVTYNNLYTELIQAPVHRGCPYLHCEEDEHCVHRKFRCKNPPCPTMLYCSKSRTGKCLDNDILVGEI